MLCSSPPARGVGGRVRDVAADHWGGHHVGNSHDLLHSYHLDIPHITLVYCIKRGKV